MPVMPGSLDEAIDELEADHEFLLKRRRLHRGRARDLDRAYKRENEIDEVRLRPHPHEFELYYDI